MIDKSILLDDKKFTVGIFDDSDKLLHAVDTLREKGVKIFDCYTPFPVHHLDKALGYHRTNLTIGAFLCGLMGSLTGFTLAYSMNVVDWPMIVGGKPQDITMFTSFIPVIFELTILFTAFGMVIMFFARSRMVHGIKEDLLSRRQTDDHMVLAIDNSEEQSVSLSEIQSLLKSEGAIEINDSREPFNTSWTDEETLSTVLQKDATTQAKKSTPAKKPAQKTKAPAKKVKASSKKAELTAEEKSNYMATVASVLGDGSGTKDDLKQIDKVSAKLEKTLNSIGVFSYEQVSKLTPEAIKAIEALTSYTSGKIQKDNWIDQAKKLMK